MKCNKLKRDENFKKIVFGESLVVSFFFLFFKTRVQRVDPFQNRSCSVSTDEASKMADNKTHSSDIYEQKYHVRYSPEVSTIIHGSVK